jgi:hypothetical protein
MSHRDAVSCTNGCTYSKALHQPRPRLCVRCGKPEPDKEPVTEKPDPDITPPAAKLEAAEAMAYRAYQAALRHLAAMEKAHMEAQQAAQKALMELNAHTLGRTQ